MAITLAQAAALLAAFGPNTTVYETSTAEEILSEVNTPRSEDWSVIGYGGDAKAWADIALTVNDHHMSPNYNDNQSEAWNEKVFADYKAWKKEIKASVDACLATF